MIPEKKLKEEAKNELNKIKEIEKTVNRENLIYRTNEYTQSLKILYTINKHVWLRYLERCNYFKRS